MSQARIRELERLLEASERERNGLLEAVQDTLDLQRIAEEVGSTSEEEPLLRSFLRALGRIVPWTAAQVRLRGDSDGGAPSRTVLREGIGPDEESRLRELEEEGLLHFATGTLKPALLPSLDAPDGPGWLVVPLVVQGTDIGFAALLPRSSTPAPTEHRLEMVRLVASQVAVALDNIAHIEEIHRSYAELRSLHQVAASLGRSLDLSRLFDIVREAAQSRMGARVAALAVFDAQGRPLHLLAHGATPEACLGLLARIGTAKASLRLDVSLPSGKDLQALGCVRALGCPLIHGESILGALLVADPDGGVLELPSTQEWLDAVASLLASAVDNARLFEEVLATNRRISDLQSRMIQAGRMAGVGQLAGGLAHEINNPLQVILGRVQILQVKSQDDPDLQADLSRMESEIMRIAHIVRSLQNFARQEGTGKPGEPSRLSTLVESVLDLVGHRLRRQEITVARLGFEDSPIISGDLDQLRHVVLNLCLNAIQAMPSGGTLTLETRIRDDMAVLEVGDTGSGIPPEDIERIFDPFFTRGEGMGLGLALAFAVAQRHGGSLHAVPGLPEGARFRLILPRFVP